MSAQSPIVRYCRRNEAQWRECDPVRDGAAVVTGWNEGVIDMVQDADGDIARRRDGRAIH